MSDHPNFLALIRRCVQAALRDERNPELAPTFRAVLAEVQATLEPLQRDIDQAEWCRRVDEASANRSATPTASIAPKGDDGARLWLWKNGDHYLAFEHLYPCFTPGGDPMTLGEPAGFAIFKRSFNRGEKS